MTRNRFKICFKCNESKPLSEYYKHSRMADGHLNKCKSCAKLDVTSNRDKNLDYYREYDKVRNKDPATIARKVKASSDWAIKNPIKTKAVRAVGSALKKKLLTRPCVCTYCGVQCVPHAHHSSYSEDMHLVVTWLCAACHSQIHKEAYYERLAAEQESLQ